MGDATATSVGGLLRVNFSDWVSVSARLATVVAGEGVPTGGFSTTLALRIEPRLWCEHVTRKKCDRAGSSRRSSTEPTARKTT